jgi:large subunit ribosomal protein L15
VKLHDLRPAAGARKARTRVGRGIAAGKGKTAGRGTKGQRARAGASIPAWFEGGQTPIHVRVPKLRGFRNAFKVEYQVVNVGRIAEYAAAGRFGVDAAPAAPAKRTKKAAAAPISVNPAALAAAGLIRSEGRPVKILGQGDVELALFVAAEAFTASARSKIEAAGGFVQLLAADGAPVADADQPAASTPEPAAAATEPAAMAPAAPAPAAEPTEPAPADEPAEPAPAAQAAEPAMPAKRPARRRKASAEAEE